MPTEKNISIVCNHLAGGGRAVTLGKRSQENCKAGVSNIAYMLGIGLKILILTLMYGSLVETAH